MMIMLYVSIILYLTSQWYVSTLTLPKAVLLVIHLTNINTMMKSLMELTSLLLVETLSDSDHIKVYVIANNISANCTGEINRTCTATLSHRIMIEKCIVNNLNVRSVPNTSADMIIITVTDLCHNFNNR